MESDGSSGVEVRNWRTFYLDCLDPWAFRYGYGAHRSQQESRNPIEEGPHVPLSADLYEMKPL